MINPPARKNKKVNTMIEAFKILLQFYLLIGFVHWYFTISKYCGFDVLEIISSLSIDAITWPVLFFYDLKDEFTDPKI